MPCRVCSGKTWVLDRQGQKNMVFRMQPIQQGLQATVLPSLRSKYDAESGVRMIEGIEILSQSVCAGTNETALLLCTLICIILGLILDLCNDLSDGILGAIAGFLVGIFAYAIIFQCIFPDKFIKYKVTISEEVSMTEFYEKYEIIDVDGAIYTIREKENEN